MNNSVHNSRIRWCDFDTGGAEFHVRAAPRAADRCRHWSVGCTVQWRRNQLHRRAARTARDPMCSRPILERVVAVLPRSLSLVRLPAIAAVALALALTTCSVAGASSGAYPPESTLRPGKIKRGPDGQIILVPDERSPSASPTKPPESSRPSRPATKPTSKVEIDEVLVHPGHGHRIVIEGRDFRARGAKSAVWLADAPQWEQTSLSVDQNVVSWSDTAIEIVVDYGPLTGDGKHRQVQLHALEEKLPDVWVFVRDERGDINAQGTRLVMPLVEVPDAPAPPSNTN